MSEFVQFGSLEVGSIFQTNGGRWKKIKTTTCVGQTFNALSTSEKPSVEFMLFDDNQLVQINKPIADIIPFPSRALVVRD